MDIKTVGIVGAGQMGNGIAHVFALSGFDVLMTDVSRDALDAAIELPGKVLETGAEIVTRIPEIPIKAVEGIARGVEKGVKKVEDALD